LDNDLVNTLPYRQIRCVKCGIESTSIVLGLCVPCHPIETDDGEVKLLRDENSKLVTEIEKLKQFIAHKGLTTDWTSYVYNKLRCLENNRMGSL
jgi:hypothetical protein